MDELDSNWDLESFAADKSSTWASAVESIHLCALRNEKNEGDELGSPPTNHWNVCLQTSSSTSIEVDMAPGYGDDGLRGKIQVKSLDSPYTHETLRKLTFKPSEGLTIGQLLTHISSKGRQKFSFHPSWEGCRHWLAVVLMDWEELGAIEAGSAAMAKEALGRYWVNPEGSMPLPAEVESYPRELREGTFKVEQAEEGHGKGVSAGLE